MPRPLICALCGGPLPKPEAAARFVTCRFCEATSDLESGVSQQGKQPTALVRERYKRELDAFEASYLQAATGKALPAVAFRAAAERTLAELCDAEAITNVVFGIAADFQRAHGADITRDPNAVLRLAAAYLGALEHLRAAPQYEINLPFLTATAEGPLHFSQVITLQRLTELAQQPPAAPAKSLWSRWFG